MQMVLLFSHHLSDEQKSQAHNLGITHFLSLPKDLQQLWSNIPPEEADIAHYLQPIKQWFEDVVNSGDFALIQGDFGACYHMANFAKTHSVTPLYATTQRVAIEKTDQGKTLKTSIFQHIRYREYQ